jgi:hypothetical protein
MAYFLAPGDLAAEQSPRNCDVRAANIGISDSPGLLMRLTLALGFFFVFISFAA